MYIPWSITDNELREMKCRGCGDVMRDDPLFLSVYLSTKRRCLAAYNEHTIWCETRNGGHQEIVYGTLHLSEHPSDSKSGKWQIFGLRRNGKRITLRREHTKTAARGWIADANRRAK